MGRRFLFGAAGFFQGVASGFSQFLNLYAKKLERVGAREDVTAVRGMLITRAEEALPQSWEELPEEVTAQLKKVGFGSGDIYSELKPETQRKVKRVLGLYTRGVIQQTIGTEADLVKMGLSGKDVAEMGRGLIERGVGQLTGEAPPLVPGEAPPEAAPPGVVPAGREREVAIREKRAIKRLAREARAPGYLETGYFVRDSEEVLGIMRKRERGERLTSTEASRLYKLSERKKVFIKYMGEAFEVETGAFPSGAMFREGGPLYPIVTEFLLPKERKRKK